MAVNPFRRYTTPQTNRGGLGELRLDPGEGDPGKIIPPLTQLHQPASELPTSLPSFNVDLSLPTATEFTDYVSNPINAAPIGATIGGLFGLPGSIIGAGIGANIATNAVDDQFSATTGYNPDVSGWNAFINAISMGYFGQSAIDAMQDEYGAFSGIDNVFGYNDALSQAPQNMSEQRAALDMMSAVAATTDPNTGYSSGGFDTGGASTGGGSEASDPGEGDPGGMSGDDW
jgi:hypothetical protein